MERSRWLFLCLMLLLLLSGACSETSEVTISDDGDSEQATDGDDSNVEYVELKGGSTGEGNPAVLTISFSSVDHGSDVQWSLVELDLMGVFLSEADPCNRQTGAFLGSESSSTLLSLLDSASTRLRVWAPSEREYCAMDFRLAPNSLAAPSFAAEGLTADGKRIVIKAALDTGLTVVPTSGNFQWQPDEVADLVMNLDLASMLPSGIFDRIVPDEAGDFLIDSDHNSDLLESVEETIVRAFSLISDTNADGVASEQESSQGRVGEGDPDVLPDEDCEQPPVPTFNEQPVNVGPLDIVHLDACQDDAGMQYYFEWAPNGRPAMAQDAVLISSTGNFDNPQSIMDRWTGECQPKLYVPVSGKYTIRLKVKDAAGNASGPNGCCPDCAEYAELTISVRPEKRLYVSLLWDRGDNVDMDLYLVRHRPDGTFGLPSAFQDRIRPEEPVAMACEDNSDCSDESFICQDGLCKLPCDDDRDCRRVYGGWECGSNMLCELSDDNVVHCESDADCPEGFCSIADIMGLDSMICTKHEADAVNDTCFYANSQPMWGPKDNPLQISCTTEEDCNGDGESFFICVDGICDYSCDDTSQCIGANARYHCGESGQCLTDLIEDDPMVDVDDVDGWGPETISLKEPAPGRYRVVTRLYADPNMVVSDESPVRALTAYIQIYIDGEISEVPLAHEFTEDSTYWKVADIQLTEDGGQVEPICAGWTATACESNDECTDNLGADFECARRSWGKHCSSCEEGGNPDECNPSYACNSNADCVGSPASGHCVEIFGSYCRCGDGSGPEDFDDNPYSNPMRRTTGSVMDPADQVSPASIWCDGPNDQINESLLCSELYGN